MSTKTDEFVFLSIGHGGWSARPDRNTTVSHYGETWKTHRFAPDAVGVDLTVVPWEELCSLSMAGPMCDPFLPDGTVSRAFGSELVPFVPGAHHDRDPRFGNARSLDYVALDVYVGIARSFGARVFSPADPDIED